DPNTGRLVTHEYRMEGPTAIFSTTTSYEVDEELLNRCIVLSTNEDRDQTRAIHRLQRERHTPEGLWARQEARRLRTLHQNAQRLLRALPVANPYARHLTFLDDKTRTRRDHEKYLTLIEVIALLHQYQRPMKREIHEGEVKEYIGVTLADIAIANRLANEVLGRSLDELPPQTRRLLELIYQMVREACERLKVVRSDYRFSRKEIRECTGWNDTVLRKHLDRLVVLEYLLVHRGTRGQSFVYELLYDGEGQEGQSFMMGLIDVQRLTVSDTHEESSRPLERSSRPLSGQFAPPSRPQSAPFARGSHGGQNPVSFNNGNGSSDFRSKVIKNTHIGGSETNEAGQYQEAI
ncbi:MAG: DNA primase, partial [Patescibacteria group bacterium]